MTRPEAVRQGRELQQFEDDLVHRWYRFVLGYPDHLITKMLERFDAADSAVVLDPFCGTGTTLVECKLRGINSVGIDANPASVLASAVKTDWSVDPDRLMHLAETAIHRTGDLSTEVQHGDLPLFSRAETLRRTREHLLAQSPEARYLVKSGMIARQWIDEVPFLVSVALLLAIKDLASDDRYVRALKLALAACMVESIANVRFGPELYVVPNSGSHDVLGTFRAKVTQMAEDLRTLSLFPRPGKSQVLLGDARVCDAVLQDAQLAPVDFVITSPPYPTEKDYTRNTRLEMVYLGYVHDNQSLRRTKRAMIRSHSKGIYKDDSDGTLVHGVPEIAAIISELREKVSQKTYGFAKQYPRIIEEYFGGMYRHFRALARTMRPGGRAAFVVGEQRTYLQTFTPTGSILAKLAERPEVGFRTEDLLVWRVRQGTTGSGDAIKEEILILQRT